ncbi:ABC transporter permease [Hymenobacter lutimineralis]|uniref:ABC transporter permease n=1 Tax=Hymenobacter lutimineralis TaxID=2606448 RepID=A0A5D6VG26_9BACT|nr:ABC transporter permease [Hymenobacter lutimineralis]TYZ14320.1 ABC transporter permease [Hymenobacter lutimineralis]
MQETIYTSASAVATPRAFLRELRRDLRVLLPVSRQLFVRNLKVQVRQSVLGYAWMLIPPVVVGLVWTFLGRARIVSQQELSVPYPVFVMAGVFLWQGFVEAVQCPLQQLTAVKATLAKVRVPHEAFLVAGMGVVVFNQVVRLLLLVLVLPLFGLTWSPTLLLVPVGVGALLLFGLALGWLLAPVGLLYTDLSNALAIALNLWFLVTPVVYTPPVHLASWLRLNPVAPLLATTRRWLLGEGLLPTLGFNYVLLGSGALLLVSWLVYRVARPHLIARM